MMLKNPTCAFSLEAAEERRVTLSLPSKKKKEVVSLLIKTQSFVERSIIPQKPVRN